MRTESDSRRGDYYQKRLADSVLDLRPDLTSSVVATVMAERPAGRYHLVKLCRKQIEKHGLDNDPDFEASPGEFASALVERGVLAITPGNHYDAAIPSMTRWMGVSANGRTPRGGRLD